MCMGCLYGAGTGGGSLRFRIGFVYSFVISPSIMFSILNVAFMAASVWSASR